MLETIFEPTPLWITILTFIFGWSLGWFMRGWYDHTSVDFQIKFEGLIQFTIFFLWTIATTRAVLIDSVAYPPFFLNLMFGAIVGSMNRGLGEYIINLAKTLIDRK